MNSAPQKSPKLQFVELGILKLYYYQRTKIQPCVLPENENPAGCRRQPFQVPVLKLYYYQRTKIQPAAGDGGSYYYKQEEEEKEKREEEEEVIIDTPPFQLSAGFRVQIYLWGVIIVTFTLGYQHVPPPIHTPSYLSYRQQPCAHHPTCASSAHPGTTSHVVTILFCLQVAKTTEFIRIYHPLDCATALYACTCFGSSASSRRRITLLVCASAEDIPAENGAHETPGSC